MVSKVKSGAVLVLPDLDRVEMGIVPRDMRYKSVANDDAALVRQANTALEAQPAYDAGEPRNQDRRAPSDALKRVMDLALAIPLALFLIPVLLLIALAVYIDDRGPVIFRHTRRGKDGKQFTCLKFRSMVTDAGPRLDALLASDPALRREWEATQKIKDDPRLTGIGGFLRRYSLDELPQLWNIIRGEMSIVGPRPIIAEEVRRYGEDIAHYDAVRPGVVGLWQINGRNDTSYAERVALDVEYARTRTIFMDVGILLSSIPAILSRRGAY